MEKNKEFLRENGRIIKMTLRSSRLTNEYLKRRFDLMRKTYKQPYDIEVLNKLEEKMKSIIDTGKERFSEEEIDIILHNVLGLEIRDYDKSHLVNLELGEVKSIRPYPTEDTTTYTFGDISITHIGTLKYTDGLGIEDLDGLPYYKVVRQNKNCKFSTYKVFSHINIGLMESDSDYRAAVLDTLLDENNITKTNCGGYIGTIGTVAEGSGLEDTVKANSKYSLIFDRIDATAVVKLREEVEKQANNRDGEER